MGGPTKCQQLTAMLVRFVLILFALCFAASSQHYNVEIKLELLVSCITAAKFEWLLFGLTDNSATLNCSVYYSHANDFNTSRTKVRHYPHMKAIGSFTLEGLDSKAGRQFSVQLRCGDTSSDIKTFVINDKKSCNDTGETKMDGPVMFKDDTSILGTRDSLLGMFIGLLGLIIIAVTTFYVVRKIRRRNRLERIRRYLGSSLIDPFENLPNRVASERETGSERLMGSTEPLYLNRTSGEQFIGETAE